MTVNTLNSIAEFDTNGVTTNFPFYFKFLANEDLVVTYVSPGGISTTLTLGSQYTVNGAGDDEGGSIVTPAPLVGPGQLVVAREMNAFQQTSLRNQGKFLAETHEDVFDRLTMLIQQGFSFFSRALMRPYGRDYFYAEDRRIASVLDPVQPQDAATKNSTDLAVAAEATLRQAADANLQSQITGSVPVEASAFSPISWHAQEIQNSVVIPPNKNAWSFGPVMTIAPGQSVTVGAGSFYTIADGELHP